MNNQEKNEDLLNTIKRGLELSYQRLLETKRLNNEELIVMNGNKIVRIKP